MSTNKPRLGFGGLATIDLVHFADELPSIGQKATADASLLDVGGPAANAAIAAALLGSNTTLHTVLGAGPMSAFARSILVSHGVETVDHAPAVDLPMASIWVDGSGDRTILSTVNKRSEVRAHGDRLALDDGGAVLLDGHYPDLQVTMARAAASAGIRVVLDCGRWRPVYAELLPLAADVIMTATFRPPQMSALSAAETVQAIYDEYQLSLCAMSRGPDAILLVDESGYAEFQVPHVDAIDTMGAGDVLHGAYVHYRYGQRLDGRTALHRAARVASHSCQFRGARGIADSE